MRGFRLRIFSLILTIAILVVSPVGALAASVSATVNCSNLPVFSQPVFSGDTYIGSISKGTQVEVVAINGAWAMITRDGNTGYTGVDYLTPVSATTTRVKGYTVCSSAVYAKASSSSTLMGTLGSGATVYLVGESGDYYKIQNADGSVTGYTKKSNLSPNKPTSNTSSASILDEIKARTVKMDWFSGGGSSLVSRGSYFYIYDILSGTLIYVKRCGGTNHMDIETANKTETAKLKGVYGGEWSWDSRPVIIIANYKCVAGAINGMPHDGNSTLSDNGLDGVICLHLTNSRTHGSDTVNENHQASINWAYSWAHS